MSDDATLLAAWAAVDEATAGAALATALVGEVEPWSVTVRVGAPLSARQVRD